MPIIAPGDAAVVFKTGACGLSGQSSAQRDDVYQNSCQPAYAMVGSFLQQRLHPNLAWRAA